MRAPFPCASDLAGFALTCLAHFRRAAVCFVGLKVALMIDKPRKVLRTNIDHGRHLLEFAQAYRRSLGLLVETHDDTIDPVLCFLASHCIELLLKYHAACLGKDEAWMEKKGHRLVSILNECKQLDPLDVPGLRKLCEQIDDANWLGYVYRFPGVVGVQFGEAEEILGIIDATEEAIQARHNHVLILSALQCAADNRPGEREWVYQSTSPRFGGRESKLPKDKA